MENPQERVSRRPPHTLRRASPVGAHLARGAPHASASFRRAPHPPARHSHDRDRPRQPGRGDFPRHRCAGPGQQGMLIGGRAGPHSTRSRLSEGTLTLRPADTQVSFASMIGVAHSLIGKMNRLESKSAGARKHRGAAILENSREVCPRSVHRLASRQLTQPWLHLIDPRNGYAFIFEGKRCSSTGIATQSLRANCLKGSGKSQIDDNA